MTIPYNPNLLPLAALAAGFGACWVTISLILKMCAVRSHMLSRKKELHHSHKVAVSRFGGVGLVVGFLVVAIGFYYSGFFSAADSRILLVVVLSSAAMFLLGFCDDLYSLGAKWKLLIQIAIASAAYFGDIRIDIVKNPVTEMDFVLGLSGYFATVFWLITLTNLINLIDGIDGLAGGISLMLMVLLATLGGAVMAPATLLAVGVAGALLGFLKFNYPPAKIYMGDGGAYFLGFLIGLLSIVNSDKGTVLAALIAPAFALALPFVDVSLAVLRRGLRGLPLFRADRKHIHHHLIALGFSRVAAVLALYGVSIFCLGVAFCVFYGQGRLLPLFAGVLFLGLLIAAHVSGFARDWFTIGSGLGKSLALRKETRYALTLGRWLELEAERRSSVEEIWQDYQFVAKKLGFTKVKLTLANYDNVWENEGRQPRPSAVQTIVHQLGDEAAIEFQADKDIMSEVLFELLSDLASETWYKAAARWQKLNGLPMEFRARPAVHLASARKPVPRFYVPESKPGLEISGSAQENVLTVP